MYHNNVMQCNRGVISIEKICKTVMHEIIKEDLGIIDVLIATCIMKDLLNLTIVSENEYVFNFVITFKSRWWMKYEFFLCILKLIYRSSLFSKWKYCRSGIIVLLMKDLLSSYWRKVGIERKMNAYYNYKCGILDAISSLALSDDINIIPFDRNCVLMKHVLWVQILSIFGVIRFECATQTS